MRGANLRPKLRWLTISVAVLLVLLAVAPFCSAATPRCPHRQPTVRQVAGPSREIAEIAPGIVIAPPPSSGALELPAAIGWLAPAGDPAFQSALSFPSLQSRAPPVR